jgi:hypothetical protein
MSMLRYFVSETFCVRGKGKGKGERDRTYNIITGNIHSSVNTKRSICPEVFVAFCVVWKPYVKALAIPINARVASLISVLCIK